MSKEIKKFFSPNFMAEFKKWINNHEDEPFVKGQQVFASKPLKKIVETIDCVDVGDNAVFEVSKYFVKNGGIIKSINEKEVLIKNKKGAFILRPEDLSSEKE